MARISGPVQNAADDTAAGRPRPFASAPASSALARGGAAGCIASDRPHLRAEIFWKSGTDAVDGIRRHVRAGPGGRARRRHPVARGRPRRRSRIPSRRASSPRPARLRRARPCGSRCIWRCGRAGMSIGATPAMPDCRPRSPGNCRPASPPARSPGRRPSALSSTSIGNYGYARRGRSAGPDHRAADPKTSGPMPGGVAPIAAHATWLACSDICIPGEAELALALPVTRRAFRPRSGRTRRCSPPRAQRLPQPAGFATRLAASGNGPDAARPRRGARRCRPTRPSRSFRPSPT